MPDAVSMPYRDCTDNLRSGDNPGISYESVSDGCGRSLKSTQRSMIEPSFRPKGAVIVPPEGSTEPFTMARYSRVIPELALLAIMVDSIPALT